MMDDLIIHIDLKDERVIDHISTEYHHSEPGSPDKKDDSSNEIVSVHTGVNHLPVIVSFVITRTHSYENEETE